MSRVYWRCTRCKAVGTASELAGCCPSPSIDPANLSAREASRRDLRALRVHLAKTRRGIVARLPWYWRVVDGFGRWIGDAVRYLRSR